MDNAAYENEKMETEKKSPRHVTLSETESFDETIEIDDGRLEIVDHHSIEITKSESFFLENKADDEKQEEHDQNSQVTQDETSESTLELPTIEMPFEVNKMALALPSHHHGKSWLGSCFEPFFSYFTKKEVVNENWEIPFVDIHDLRFLGSGSQGAVFAGKWRQRDIAVKKVRDEKDTDVRHLRKLKHRNIVEIM